MSQQLGGIGVITAASEPGCRRLRHHIMVPTTVGSPIREITCRFGGCRHVVASRPAAIRAGGSVFRSAQEMVAVGVDEGAVGEALDPTQREHLVDEVVAVGPLTGGPLDLGHGEGQVVPPAQEQ